MDLSRGLGDVYKRQLQKNILRLFMKNLVSLRKENVFTK
jgi:hypothetical protein